MTFDLQIWQGEIRERLHDWRPRMQQAKIQSAYAFISAAVLWPVAEAMQTGQEALALEALGKILGRSQSRRLAAQFLHWQNETDAAHWLATNWTADQILKGNLDTVWERLKVISLAQDSLETTERPWLAEILRAELSHADNLSRFEADLNGTGIITQGSLTANVGSEGQVLYGSQIGGNVYGPGAVSINFILDNANRYLREILGEKRPPEDMHQATISYLKYLVDRYSYLDFRGMGTVIIPPKIPLLDVYIPLQGLIKKSEGVTLTRTLGRGGHRFTTEEIEVIGERLGEPQPVLTLLEQHDGLIILGDPGAGKTTFLKYLALCLAGAEVQPLRLESRLPILLPLSDYAKALAGQDVSLDRFISNYYDGKVGAALPVGQLLDVALTQGRALLLLDGLDEIQDPVQRRVVVDRVVDFYALQRQKGNKFVLTSRIVGYKDSRTFAEGLGECVLVDFGEAEITEFVKKWIVALERAVRGDTTMPAQEVVQKCEDLLQAVHHNPGVRALAVNPLLLTILALMKLQGLTLPERRVELYHKFLETLLNSWNLARGLGRPVGQTLDDDIVEIIQTLAQLALWMHQSSPDQRVKQETLHHELVKIYAGRNHPQPEKAARQLWEIVHKHTSLLLERGEGEYSFIHRTFQEYLTAVAIVQQGQLDFTPVFEVLAVHVGDDNWHEVILLTIGYIGIIQHRDKVASEIVRQLVKVSPGQRGQAIVLAGKAVVDAGSRVVDEPTKNFVRLALTKTMTADRQRVIPFLRVAAGDALAHLGDFRPGVGSMPEASPNPDSRPGTSYPQRLPALEFCYIPAGPFWMGRAEEEHWNIHLDYDYWITRYPITVVQFRTFVDAGGYKNQAYWLEAKRVGVWQPPGQIQGRFDDTPRTEPQDFGSPFNLSNHPVVGITWYEALAFCRWLTEKFAASPQPVKIHAETVALEQLLTFKGYEFTLPSEAQWEKAARGNDKRLYPWGGSEADPNRANSRPPHLGRDPRYIALDSTSAVGCFPGGASPYGCQDMAGNVWEWSCSLWGEVKERLHIEHFVQKPLGFSYPYDPADGREDLTAGTHILRVVRGGAFNQLDLTAPCTDREKYSPYRRYKNLGFRVVMVPTKTATKPL